MNSIGKGGSRVSSAQYYRAYDFMGRQPCIVVDVDLPLGAIADTARMDAWLTGPFAVLAERMAQTCGQPADDTRDALAKAVAERALLIFGELCRAGGIPCFEPGRVLQVRVLPDQPTDRQAVVMLPVTDHVPIAVFHRILNDVLKLLLSVMLKEPVPALVSNVMDDLKRTIVDKLESALHFNSSTLPICRLAYDRDIPFRHVGNGFFQFGTGAKAAITRGSAVGRDSALGAQICTHKQIMATLFRAAGLPAAEHIVVESRAAALAAARELGWPVVVKPSNQERSQGVTTDIASEAELNAAYDLASGMGGQTLVERQVPGICHRIMIGDGRLIYAVIRYPKGVTGDGTHTVAELVDRSNAAQVLLPPWKRLKDVPLDDTALRCLADQGLGLDAVPADGRRVFMRTITSGEWGGDVENLTAVIHPDNVRLAIDAARQLGLTVAGIDLMSLDITKPWHENGGTIIEVNFDPQFATSRREADAAGVLAAIVDGDGRIPVHLVTGTGDLFAHARVLQSARAAESQGIHITSGNRSEDPVGEAMILPEQSLFARGLALAMRPDVHELILVADEVELFDQGLPIDLLDSVHVIGEDAVAREALMRRLQARFRIRS